MFRAGGSRRFGAERRQKSREQDLNASAPALSAPSKIST
jgi:hypothetical protein